jgi:hypothetical protein
MPTAEELGLSTEAVVKNEPAATSQGSTSQVPENEKDKSLDPAPDANYLEPAADDLDTSDGYTGPKSIVADEPLDGPSHNAAGHRNVVTDRSGVATVLDDDTAKVLYENPKFYDRVFHNGDTRPVETLTWANSKGNAVTVEKVGEDYELGK